MAVVYHYGGEVLDFELSYRLGTEVLVGYDLRLLDRPRYEGGGSSDGGEIDGLVLL